MILLPGTCRARNSQPQSHSDPEVGSTAQTYHNIHEHNCLQLVRPSPGSWEMCDNIHPARKRTGKSRTRARVEVLKFALRQKFRF